MPPELDPAMRVVVRIFREVVTFGNFRQDLLDQEARVAIAQGVVLVAPVVAVLLVGRGGRQDTRIDEDADGHRHLALVNQVVEHNRDTPAAGLRHHTAAILKDHHTGRFRGVVLRRHVDPVIPHRAGIDLAGERLPRDRALRNAGLALRVRAQYIVLRKDGSDQTSSRQIRGDSVHSKILR